MKLSHSLILVIILLVFSGCATKDKVTLDTRTMTPTLGGKEISLVDFQSYLENEKHEDSTVTVIGLNEVEMEMKPQEIISSFTQLADDLNVYYFPEGEERSSPDDSCDPDNLFQ